MLKSLRLVYLPMFCLLGISLTTDAQTFPLAKDPLYWKNRPPHANYWQQDVHYKIKARIDEERHLVEGNQVLQYYNNSPDTLHEVYFHLYQNAFVKDSYLRLQEKQVKTRSRLGAQEAAGNGIQVSNVLVDGQSVDLTLDNTILKLTLAKPLLPNQSIRISMDFTTYYDEGGTRRRMKMYDAWGFKHYNGCQWYPKVSVYDAKHGWDTYQHLGKEFYGDFGVYDVELDFPSNYIVEATGDLQNRAEVLPPDLREKLDIKHFKNKPWNEAPSTIIPYVKGDRKIWHFVAEHVHDFAFTADPSYRIATTYVNGVECVGLAQEPHARGWQNSAEYVGKVIKTLSEEVGTYLYPKMVAADASDGMEYPMLTLDGGSDPGYRGLLVHEIGHNWFYGMIGSNETYRAFLDEGFTQYLTALGLEKIEQKQSTSGFPKWPLAKRFFDSIAYKDLRVYNPYVRDALYKEEVPINTHSDYYNALGHGGGYRGVYYKGGTLLYQLEYILGTDLFQKALKHFFNQWKLAHPYPEDFRNSIIQYTKVDLNWFFDQFMETTKTIDYAVGKIKKVSKNTYDITLKRKQGMQMPIDITLTDKKGKTYDFYVPNTWFEKSTSAQVLPRWIGWGNVKPTYTFRAELQAPLSITDIDPAHHMADINTINNAKSACGLSKNVKWKPDFGIQYPNQRHHYTFTHRPDIWYNQVDGIKIGWHLDGHYMQLLHRLDANVWFNSHVGQAERFYLNGEQAGYDYYAPFNYRLSYATPFTLNNPKLGLQLTSRFLDGLMKHQAAFTYTKEAMWASIGFNTMWRPLELDKSYLINEREWSSAKARPNSYMYFKLGHQIKGVTSKGSVHWEIRAPFFTGQQSTSFDYGFAQVQWRHQWVLGKLDLTTRVFGRLGYGQNLPYESALFAAGANPEQLMENKYLRSEMVVPASWSGYQTNAINHFHAGGGLNLRGYAGYLMLEQKDNQSYLAYRGRSGAAINAELEFDKYIPLKPKWFKNWLSLDAYVFADAGWMEMSHTTSFNTYWLATPSTEWSSIRVDAGLGVAATIKKWGQLNKVKPLTIRLDMPFFINRPPFEEGDFIKARWVLGLERAF